MVMQAPVHHNSHLRSCTYWYQTQTWRPSLRPQHSTACIRWSRLVAVRRGVGSGGNVERRIPDNSERSRSCQRGSGQQPQAIL